MGARNVLAQQMHPYELAGFFRVPSPHLKKWGLRLFWSSGRLAPDPLDFGRTLLPSRDPTFLFQTLVFYFKTRVFILGSSSLFGA